MPEKYTIFRLLSKQFNQDKKITEQILTNGWRCASRCRFPGIPESVLLDFLDAEPLHVSLPQAEDEAGLAKFEVDLNEGRLDQVGDVLQTNGGGLVRTPKSLLFIRSGAFGGGVVGVREIHLAS